MEGGGASGRARTKRAFSIRGRRTLPTARVGKFRGGSGGARGGGGGEWVSALSSFFAGWGCGKSVRRTRV